MSNIKISIIKINKFYYKIYINSKISKTKIASAPKRKKNSETKYYLKKTITHSPNHQN